MLIHKAEQMFQPITITLTSQEELDVLVSALNASKKTLQEAWEQCRFGSIEKIDPDVAESMFWQVSNFYKEQMQA